MSGVTGSSDIEYTLLVLADGNLPTGGFVASSGLESFLAHGLNTRSEGIMPFVRSSLAAYAASALVFVHTAHNIVSSYLAQLIELEAVITELLALDALYHATVLNAPARRASTAQGVALLTLYSRGLFKMDAVRQAALVDQLKALVRRGTTPGHMPICWAVLTAALALPVDRTLHLHLFLYARGVVSAGIRLNALGPYAAQQLLLHEIRPLIEREMQLHDTRMSKPEELKESSSTEERVLATNPACTWPLGEILAARHDLQHSRIFNS